MNDLEKEERKAAVFTYYRTQVWFEGIREKNQSIPLLYFDEARSLVCARRWAFPVGHLFSSEYQARLWCGYHGFGFVLAVVQRASEGFSLQRAGLLSWRFRSREDFHVQAYASHRERCPDCRYRDSRSHVSIGERVLHSAHEARLSAEGERSEPRHDPSEGA